MNPQISKIATPDSKQLTSSTAQIAAMSFEEARALEQFKNWSDEDILIMISTVRAFTQIVYSVWIKRQQSAGQKG